MAETVRIEIPIEATDKTDPAVSGVEKKLDRVTNASNKVQNSLSKAEKSVSKFDKAQEKTQKSLAKWAKEKYEILLEAKEKITPMLSKIGGGLRGITGKTWNVTMKAFDLVTSPLRGIINLLKNPVFQVGAVLGVSISLKDTIDTYANFEQTMSRVKALADANNEQMVRLTATAKEMGAKTKFSGTESAEAFTYMAQAGWEVNDMINGIGGIMSLAAADNLDLAATTDIVSNALTAFGLKAKDSAVFADVLAVASSATNTDVAELGEAFKYIAPVAGAMGYNIKDTSIALGVMSNNAVKGSMAGTSLKTALANMAAPTKKMAKNMKKYSISLEDSEGNMKSLKGVMDNLRSSLGGLTEQEQTAAASTIFGKEAMAGMLAIINTTEEDYKKLTEAINNSEGAADKMAATMQDNLAGALEQLGGAVETVQLSWGERLKPYVLAMAGALEDNIPAIEEFGLKMFDSLDRKITEVKAKISEFTGTAAWEEADIFGKLHIAWDEIIAKPFSKWWDSKGRDFFIEKAGSIGKGIGGAVSAGLLTILGIDVANAIGEGESIGSAFASGLIDGFDVSAIQDKLWSATKGIFANAGKLLPGGQEADLSSWLSAALIAKIGLPILSAGTKGISLGKSVFGDQTIPTSSGGTTVVPGIGTKLIGSAGAGTGLLGFGSNTAIALGAGNLAGGASMSVGALSAIGLGSAAGGAVGGATLVSGGADLYKAFKAYQEDDKEKAAAYTEAGGWKVGGVAAGAAGGAAIGSVIPGLGTLVGGLIGAGVGGIAGWIQGDNVKKEYEESLKRAQEEAEALALAEEQAKYKSQELKDALADASMSGEEFGKIFRKVVEEDLKQHFGDIRLTRIEIENLAKKLTFAGNIDAMTKFTDATAQTEKTLNNFKTTVIGIDKLNWKAGLGMKLDESEVQEYITGVEQLIQNATEYLESQHYEAQTAINLLVSSDNGIDMITGLNTVYYNLQEQLNTLGSELTGKVNIALEDGVITIDEKDEIINLQEQIMEITKKVSDAQTEAGFKSIGIKYNGAKLDYETFTQLQQELKEQVEVATQGYDEALKVSISNLELQLAEDVIDQDQYNEQLEILTKNYQGEISGLDLRVESFQLDAIAQSYAEELDGIMPDIQGTTAQKLQTGLHNAIASGIDPTVWDAETAAKWLGLEGLEKEAQTEIAQLMSSVAGTIPQSVMDALQANSGSSITAGAGSLLKNAIKELKLQADNEVITAFSSGCNATLPVNIKADYRLQNPSPKISLGGVLTSINTKIAQNASGGFVSGGPQLSWLAEEGYGEYVIPTNPSRRARALELYEQAGRTLGVSAHAAGGFVGNDRYSSNPLQNSMDINYINNVSKTRVGGNNEFSEVYEDPESEGNTQIPVVEQRTESTPVQVQISVDPIFDINVGDGGNQDVVGIVKKHMKELTDEIGGELASKLEMVFSNMPVKEA